MGNKRSKVTNQKFKIDKLVHEPARLNIMAHLYVVESADAIFLLRQTGLSWGNLSSHVAKLEEVGYVEVVKGFLGKKTRTTIKLSDKGRRAFINYRNTIKELIENTY